VMLLRACVCSNVSVCWNASGARAALSLSLSLQGAVGGCIIDRAHLFGKNSKDTSMDVTALQQNYTGSVYTSFCQVKVALPL